MAGFDDATQRSCSMGGLMFESGTIAFTADSETVEVPTRLGHVWAAGGQIKCGSTTSATQTHSKSCFCDHTVTSGAVTFRRDGEYLGDTPTMAYWMVGI